MLLLHVATYSMYQNRADQMCISAYSQVAKLVLELIKQAMGFEWLAFCSIFVEGHVIFFYRICPAL